MAKTVGTLAYQIVADTKDFTAGMVATKKELRAAAAIIEETADPLDKLAQAEQNLARLWTKGALTLDQYNRALAATRKELGGVDQAAEAVAQQLALVKRVEDRLQDQAGHIFAATRTDAEKLEAELHDLDILLRKNLISIETYNRAAAKARGKPPVAIVDAKAIDTLERSSSTFAGMVPVIDPISLALRAVGEAARIASAGIAQLTDGFDQIQEVGNVAQSLGIAVAEFQAMRIAAGQADVTAEQLTQGLTKMARAVIDAGQGGQMGKLFEDLGLNIADIQAMRPEEQFREIAQAIGGMADPTAKVDAAMTIFGKSSVDLIRFMDGAGASIDATKASLAAMGLTLTDLDVANIGALDSAFKELGTVFDGIFQQLMSELAPYLTLIVEDAKEFLIENATGEHLSSALATVADVSQRVYAIWSGLLDVIKMLQPYIAWFAKNVSGVGQAASAFMVVTEGSQASVEDRVEAIKKRIALDAEARKEKLELAKAMQQATDAQEKETKSVRDSISPAEQTIKSLSDQLDKLTMGAQGYELYQAAMNDATQDELDMIFALQEEIRAVTEANRLRDDAKKAIESLKSPEEKAAEAIKKYREMLDAGAINLDQYIQLRQKTLEDTIAKSGRGGRETFTNPAAMRGSQEAIQMLANARFGTREDKQQRMIDLLDKIAKNSGRPPVEVNEESLN